MKVVKKGRKQSDWAKEYVCTGTGNGNGGCHAVLLVEKKDLFYTSFFVKDGTDYYVGFECSECKVVTEINDTPFNYRDLPSLKDWRKKQLCES